MGRSRHTAGGRGAARRLLRDGRQAPQQPQITLSPPTSPPTHQGTPPLPLEAAQGAGQGAVELGPDRKPITLDAQEAAGKSPDARVPTMMQ